MGALQEMIDQSMLAVVAKEANQSDGGGVSSVGIGYQQESPLKPNLNAARAEVKRYEWIEKHQNEHRNLIEQQKKNKTKKNEKDQLKKLKSSKAAKEKGIQLRNHAARDASIVHEKGKRGKGAKISRGKA
jgi:hypothetical protein